MSLIQLLKGRGEFKKWISQFQEKLLDAKTESIDLFSNPEGNKVVSRWICSGKNNGLFGLKANKRFISFTGMAIWTVKDGRLSAYWMERSALELYQDLASDELVVNNTSIIVSMGIPSAKLLG